MGDREVKTVPPVKKGQVVTLVVTDLASNGEGVGRYQGFTIFVPGTLPGEEVRARVISLQKSYARALATDVVRPAANRAAAICSAYPACGGCQLQHLAYSDQLRFKQQVVERALHHIGKLDGVEVLPTLGMEKPWAYRNKAQFPLAQRGKRLVAGFYAPRSHQVVEITTCPLQLPQANVALKELLAAANELGIPAYDEQTGEGFLRHLLVRSAVRTGELMVVVVARSAAIPRLPELTERLVAGVPGLTSLLLNVNPRRTNVILGEEWHTLWGKPSITEYLGPYRFTISGASFFQVNPTQTVKLYQKVVEFAALTGIETVVDAYCGIGTISLFLAAKAKRVYGIEVVPSAVEDARLSARENGIENAEFYQGEVEEVLPRLVAAGVKPDVMVVDPPRQGCRSEVLLAMAAAMPARIVYVSCNPATLARDLGILAQHGLSPRIAQPVDMFPQTYHVECVTWIQKK
ncbi:MAG: 23S rRNA (uracil(1939)-C(5))-methyltransferase RlmD, partial [Firmicutes bacterium]|nr:23S rRNA (uracil(1939)-C(5))-methyltransferase RlmD [Bacillota bacterium]